MQKPFPEIETAKTNTDELMQCFLHDLSGPLSILQMQLEQAGRDITHEQIVSVKSLLSKAQQGLSHVNRMVVSAKTGIDDSAELSFSAVHQLNQLCDWYGLLATEHEIDLIQDYLDDKILLGSSTIFNRCLANVIQNAIEALATVKGTKQILIATKRTVSSFIVSISDNGIGIQPHLLPLLCNKGFSNKGTNRGYGLYNVKKQMAKHFNAEINIATNKSKGTKVRLIFR
ncbi:MAG: Sensor protein CitS [candidate division WS6 bacterium OLB21]|uniref:histidine kinase n=2 Tax=Candidatus Dojkabacteria TaxID=74243 RepID=A0A136KIM3_9BACT|nr:MAG: Sensor protein CitS [candidate division WS6 bacterium OLB21]